jgi:hypothetical protein
MPAPSRPLARDAFDDWLATDLAAQRGATLVISAQRSAPTALPSGIYETVYLDRVVAIAAPSAWLDRAHRALAAGGRLVVGVDPAEFSFAPLPAGGDVQLLGRLLGQAGFCRVELVHRSARRVVVSAQRVERASPR